MNPVTPRGLAGRLMIAFVATIVTSMLLLAAIVPELARTHQVTMLEDRLADEAQLVADYVVAELGHDSDANLDALAKRLGQRAQTRLTIIALDGTVLGESSQDLSKVGNHASRREVQQAISTGRGVDLHLSQTVGYDMLYVAVPIVQAGKIIGTSRTALPLSQVNESIGQLTRAILLAGFGSGLLAILIAIIAAKAITRPLARFTRFASALSQNPSQSKQVWLGGGPKEILDLGRTLESMAVAIRENLQRVRLQRDRLDAVLANLSDGVVIIEDGRVTRLNKAAERLLHLSEVAAKVGTVAEVLRDHELIELVETANHGAMGSVVTRFLERANPRRFIRAVAGRYGHEAAPQTLLLVQDLTELRRLETIRRDFVANVSHELRTPISAIKAMVETLENGAIDDRDAARDFLARIQEEIDGLHRMVEELLELARLESGKVEVFLVPVDASQLIVGAVRRLAPMAERAGVSLRAEAVPDLPRVMADKERMDQVLVNLIHNAIKFTPRGGTIVTRAIEQDDRVVLSVADTGAGIDDELLPRIFERFYKADSARATGGTGLGLAIAKHTVQLHSGTIWAASDGPGRGATFNVSLPKAPE